MKIDNVFMYRSIAGIALVLAIGFFATRNAKPQAEIMNFIACVKAGYPVSGQYPSVCQTPDGKKFTEPFSPSESVNQTPIKTIFTRYGELTLSFQDRVASLEGKLTRMSACSDWQTKVSGTKDAYASLVQFTVFNESKSDNKACTKPDTKIPQQIQTQAAANPETIYTVIIGDEQVFFGKLGIDVR